MFLLRLHDPVFYMKDLFPCASLPQLYFRYEIFKIKLGGDEVAFCFVFSADVHGECAPPFFCCRKGSLWVSKEKVVLSWASDDAVSWFCWVVGRRIDWKPWVKPSQCSVSGSLTDTGCGLLTLVLSSHVGRQVRTRAHLWPLLTRPRGFQCCRRLVLQPVSKELFLPLTLWTT